MDSRLLLEWRTQQALEFETKNRQFTKEETFEDNQMVYLLAPHSSALQTSTTKFRQDFIGPLFIDLKSRIANMNQKLTLQYRMMQLAHHRYNLLFRWTDEMPIIHHFA